MNSQVGWWRPTGALARALMALLGVQAVGQLVQIADGTPRSLDRLARAIDATLAGNQALAERRFENISSSSDTGFFQITGIVTLAVLVLFIIWQWRSTHNARALGRSGARISPAWVIAGWLVPIANFFVPYLGLQDLWRNTDSRAEPGSEWRKLPGSPLVTSFWITYVVGLLTPIVVTFAVLATSVDARDTDSYTRAGIFVYAASSVMGIFVVRQITMRQETQQATTPAPTGPTNAANAGYVASGGGGWFPDPLQRFEHRYWDGAIWTDWVSTNGQMSIDPEPVPGYDSDSVDGSDSGA